MPETVTPQAPSGEPASCHPVIERKAVQASVGQLRWDATRPVAVATAAATVATQASPGSAGEDLLEAVSIYQLEEFYEIETPQHVVLVKNTFTRSSLCVCVCVYIYI